MDQAEAFQTLGLTATEARAYRELLREPRDARSLSMSVKATYPAIYRTLNALVRKGWITATITRPRLFTANAPDTVMTAAKQAALRRLETALRVVLPEAESSLADLEILKGFGAAMGRFTNLAKSARENLFCVSPGPLDWEVLAAVRDALAACPQSVEWYLNVANRADLNDLAPLATNVRALAVITKPSLGPTRVEHTFLFSGRSRMLTLDAVYREGRLDPVATHGIYLADAEVVRVQLEALVESTRVLAGRPVLAP